MENSANEKVLVGDILPIALIPLAIIGLYFYWKVAWAVDDGIFYPKPARLGLLFFPIMGVVLFGFRSIVNRLQKTITIGAAIAIVGIVASISFVQLAEVFSERFNLYKGDRFFSPITLEDLENTQDSRATGIYYIGNDYCSECIEFDPIFTNLVGSNKVLISHYTPLSNSELISKQEDILQIHGVNSIPTVLVIKEGIVTHLFDGDNIDKQVRQYFEELKP